MSFDLIIFQYINSFAGRNQVLDWVGIFFAEYSQYVIIAVLGIIFLYLWKKKSKKIIMVWIALISAVIARFFIKCIIVFLMPRPRPFVILPSAHQLVASPVSENLQSFPSGHTLFFFALATGIFFYDKKMGMAFYVAALLMGLARIFSGLHWPSDVLGGAVIGIMTACLIELVYNKLRIKS